MSEHEDRETAAKYDALADRYSAGRYANPAAVARYFARLVRGWGPPPGNHATVLEIGCADGFVTEVLAREGYRVTAVDLSPRMIEVAGERLRRAGLEADLAVADINGLELQGHFDVVLACMESFFRYARDPAATLLRLHGICGSKLIVDANPRETALSRALDDVRSAGFPEVASRPIAAPQRMQLGAAGTRVLEAALAIPPVRASVLRRKLNVAILGVR